jgi:predicted lipoprotein with Yx(FWY)xxD motif
MKALFRLLTYSLLVATLFLSTSCEDDDEMTPDASGKINLATDASLGEILVDGNGNTLYYFTRDVNGESACSGGCLDSWPIYYSEDLEVGTGLSQADFGTITRGDGEMQSTYRGWPLYYYSPTSDGTLEAAGETSGEARNDVWYVVKPSYSLMLANAQLVGHDGLNYTSDYTEGEEVTQYFTDINGRTLYIFVNDTRDTNNFTNEDFSNDAVWPIFYVDLEELPSTMDEDDFGVISVFGRDQLTYRGWPLYYFGQDTQRGENKGVSFPVPGIWPIANLDTPEAP